MRILVENSSWNNIGDGFYQFSLAALLRKEFPQHEIAYLNAPTTRSFRVSPRFEKNIFDPEYMQDGDLYVFSGPILNNSFKKDYAPLIEAITRRGKRYALISVHGAAASQAELTPFLAKFPPVILSSRDSATYELYKQCNFPTYDGVCAASLVSLTCDVGDIDPARKYIASSFYEGYEPPFTVSKDADGYITDVSGVGGWKPEPNWRVMRHLEWLMKKYPSEVAGYEVIRPIHDIAYKFDHLNFARKNTFITYNPMVYLALFKGAQLTVTNRLHAALPTLSYGNPVCYVGKTARNGAIDRLGFREYQGKLMRLEDGVIEREYRDMANAIRSAGI